MELGTSKLPVTEPFVIQVQHQAESLGSMLNSGSSVPLTGPYVSVISFLGDLNSLTKTRSSVGIGHPEHRIFRGLGIRIAAQVSEIDQAHRRNLVFGDPLEGRAEVCAATALGLKTHWLRGPKLLGRLNRRVTVYDVDRFRLRLLGNCRDFTCKLLQLKLSDRARGVDDDHDVTQAPALDRGQVQARSDIAPIGWCPAIVRGRSSSYEIAQDRAPILPRFAAFAQPPF